MPLQKVLKAVGISCGWLDSKVASAHYMDENMRELAERTLEKLHAMTYEE